MSTVLTRTELVTHAQRAGFATTTGALVLLPVPSRTPDEARMLLGRGSVTEGNSSWRAPHELVRLSPWDGAVLGHELLVSRMGGVELRPGVQLQRPASAIGSEQYFAALDELDRLQPRVWTWYLRRGRPERDEVQRYTHAFRTLVRVGEEPYYRAISGDFDAWTSEVVQ